MIPNDNTDYNPAEDENQGVITKLAQGVEANSGISQVEHMSPVTAQGPEPIKEEVNDHDDGPSDTDANGVNDDLLMEEEVEEGKVDVEYEEGDN